MAWKEMTLEELAKSLGADFTEVREKQKLIDMIHKIRKAKKLSQATLAKKLGVSQATPPRPVNVMAPAPAWACARSWRCQPSPPIAVCFPGHSRNVST